jgi:hypothetical protein
MCPACSPVLTEAAEPATSLPSRALEAAAALVAAEVVEVGPLSGAAADGWLGYRKRWVMDPWLEG